MKFVCERCQTKYSIADEKVRGKVLKVRCKTCAHVITVREAAKASVPSLAPVREATQKRSSSSAMPVVGARGAQAPARTAPPPPPSDALESEVSERTVIAAIPTGMMDPPPPPRRQPTRALSSGVGEGDEIPWFLALDGNQQGPFSRKVLIDRVMALPRDADVHVWNERMDGWKEPLEVEAIAHEIAARRRPPPPPARSASSRATPAPPQAALGAGRGRTQPLAPLPGPHHAGGPRLPPPSIPGIAYAANAAGDIAIEELDPSVLEAHVPHLHMPPSPHPPPGRQTGRMATLGYASNGMAAHGGRASAPMVPLQPGESDALSALNLGSVSARNGGVTGARGRVLPASAIASWGAAASMPEMAQGRHRSGKFILGFLGIVGVVCAVLLFAVMKRPPPAAAPARPSQTDEQLAAVMQKLAEAEKSDPKPGSGPSEAPDTVVVKGKGAARGHGSSRQMHVTSGRGQPTAPTAAGGAAVEDASAARFRDTGARALQLPARDNSSGRGAPSQADITRVITNNKNGIKTCYQRALLRDSSLTHGKLSVRVGVGISGRVKSVGVEGPEHFRTLEPCIREVVTRWMFPPSSEEYATEFVSSFQGNE